MRDVYDFAMYFVKKGADTLPNTYDGNMKLQKLLTFSELISVAQYNEKLFNEDILAFKNGCVIEKIRLRYKKDYAGLKHDSDEFLPDFSEQEYNVLNTVMDIFGPASAKELSDINHTFSFWSEAFKNGTNENGFHDKERSVVNMRSNQEDLDKICEIIDAYNESSKHSMSFEIINGITFYYDDFILTDEIIEELESFSEDAEDDTYTVYFDNEKLVIY